MQALTYGSCALSIQSHTTYSCIFRCPIKWHHGMLNSIVSVNSRLTKLNFPYLGSRPKKKGKRNRVESIGINMNTDHTICNKSSTLEILVEIRCLKALRTLAASDSSCRSYAEWQNGQLHYTLRKWFIILPFKQRSVTVRNEPNRDSGDTPEGGNRSWQ